MDYNQLIETISTIVENEKICKVGLTLTYELDAKNHKQMNEQLFYGANPATDKFIPTDEFEAELGGIIVKFKKQTENEL